MTTLHLMVGLPCSGKTTYAKKLAEAESALLFTPDVWQLKLFGQDFPGPYHDIRHSLIEEIMWNVAKDALLLGTSVILDFGFWSKTERDDFKMRAKLLNVKFKMHYMNIKSEELFKRLEKRNINDNANTFIIPIEEMERFIPLFEVPTKEELEI